MACIDRSRYWAAYRRGVQRGVCGPRIVPNVEHVWRLRASSASHPEDYAGYVDGLKFAEDLLKNVPVDPPIDPLVDRDLHPPA